MEREAETPTLPRDERQHLCAVCSDRGTPWYGRRGDHGEHDKGLALGHDLDKP